MQTLASAQEASSRGPRPDQRFATFANSAGIFQVDELLATKLRGSGLEEHIEVIARIDAEHEQRLIEVFKI